MRSHASSALIINNEAVAHALGTYDARWHSPRYREILWNYLNAGDLPAGDSPMMLLNEEYAKRWQHLTELADSGTDEYQGTARSCACDADACRLCRESRMMEQRCARMLKDLVARYVEHTPLVERYQQYANGGAWEERLGLVLREVLARMDAVYENLLMRGDPYRVLYEAMCNVWLNVVADVTGQRTRTGVCTGCGGPGCGGPGQTAGKGVVGEVTTKIADLPPYWGRKISDLAKWTQNVNVRWRENYTRTRPSQCIPLFVTGWWRLRLAHARGEAAFFDDGHMRGDIVSDVMTSVDFENIRDGQGKDASKLFSLLHEEVTDPATLGNIYGLSIVPLLGGKSAIETSLGDAISAWFTTRDEVDKYLCEMCRVMWCLCETGLMSMQAYTGEHLSMAQLCGNALTFLLGSVWEVGEDVLTHEFGNLTLLAGPMREVFDSCADGCVRYARTVSACSDPVYHIDYHSLSSIATLNYGFINRRHLNIVKNAHVLRARVEDASTCTLCAVDKYGCVRCCYGMCDVDHDRCPDMFDWSDLIVESWALARDYGMREEYRDATIATAREWARRNRCNLSGIIHSERQRELVCKAIFLHLTCYAYMVLDIGYDSHVLAMEGYKLSDVPPAGADFDELTFDIASLVVSAAVHPHSLLLSSAWELSPRDSAGITCST